MVAINLIDLILFKGACMATGTVELIGAAINISWQVEQLKI